MFAHPPGIIRRKGRKSQAVRKVFLRGQDRARSGRGQSRERARGIINIHNKLIFIMDALKSAGRAIIRSPSLAKQSWISGKHKSEFHSCQSARICLEMTVIDLVYVCGSVLKFRVKVVCNLCTKAGICSHFHNKSLNG